MVQISDTLRF